MTIQLQNKPTTSTPPRGGGVMSTITTGVKALAEEAPSPLFKQHSCMVCEDTGLVATSHQNAAGEYLNGRCWKQCKAGDSVVWSPDQEQWVQPGDKVRFTLHKSEGSSKKPWVVEDTHSNPAEDPVMYHFSSKIRAERFKADMEAEYCTPNAPAAH